MNCTTAIAKPCPCARSAQPMAEVVLPFPLPVMTRRIPLRVSRGWSGPADPNAASRFALVSGIVGSYHPGGGVSNAPAGREPPGQDGVTPAMARGAVRRQPKWSARPRRAVTRGGRALLMALLVAA